MIFGYVRVSTPSQINGRGIESQLDDIASYCKLCHLKLDNIFSDIGISALSDRENLNKMLDQLDANSIIIVQSVDRLWRSTEMMDKIKSKIIESNSDVISILEPGYSIYKQTEQRDLYNSGVDIATIVSRNNINARLGKGRREKAKCGFKPNGSAPYGYMWNGDIVVPDANKRNIVTDIFRKYNECMSYSETMRYCHNKGYKTNSGRNFSVQAIKNIIHNDFYIGVIHHGDVTVSGNQEPLVSKELFASCAK